MNPGEARSATLWMRAASGIEVLTGLGLIVAPSFLAWLLFGSDLNAAGKATGRIAGLVMVCLAAGCWPRGAGTEAHALAPLMALSGLATVFLIVIGLIGATRRCAALACRGAAPDSCDPAHASLDGEPVPAE